MAPSVPAPFPLHTAARRLAFAKTFLYCQCPDEIMVAVLRNLGPPATVRSAMDTVVRDIGQLSGAAHAIIANSSAQELAEYYEHFGPTPEAAASNLRLEHESDERLKEMHSHVFMLRVCSWVRTSIRKACGARVQPKFFLGSRRAQSVPAVRTFQQVPDCLARCCTDGNYYLDGTLLDVEWDCV